MQLIHIFTVTWCVPIIYTINNTFIKYAYNDNKNSFENEYMYIVVFYIWVFLYIIFRSTLTASCDGKHCTFSTKNVKKICNFCNFSIFIQKQHDIN